MNHKISLEPELLRNVYRREEWRPVRDQAKASDGRNVSRSALRELHVHAARDDDLVIGTLHLRRGMAMKPRERERPADYRELAQSVRASSALGITAALALRCAEPLGREGGQVAVSDIFTA